MKFRLVPRVKGDGRRDGVGETFMGQCHTFGAGEEPAESRLDGEPPVAVSGGWGDMSWLQRRRVRL